MAAIGSHTPVPHPGRSPVRRAWWSLAMFPVSFVAAMVVGEGTPALLGYDNPSLDTTPWWVIGLAFALAVVVFVLPLLPVLHFGRQALAQGDPSGRNPIAVALVVTAVFVGLNLVSGLLQLVLG